VTTYAYDGLGNLRSQTSPDTGTTTYDYDAAGNRTQQTDASNVITHYSYDALNRLTNVTYPADASKNIIYSYDATNNANRGIGYMTGMQDSSGSTLWNYDEFGRERLRQTTINGRTYSWSMTYDSANRLSTVRYPSGRKVRYVRNTVGQVIAVYTSA
jgi:YD repeat-containing protein